MKYTRYGFLFLSLFMLSITKILAQKHSDFDIVQTDAPEVIYKGTCTFEDIKQVEVFHFARQADDYKPKEEVIRKLAELLPGYEIVLVLGTWCEDSHRLVPQLYKVLEAADFNMAHIDIFAVDREKKGKYAEEQTYEITQVPTIIMYRDSAESGRITETVNKSVEEDLLYILTKE